MLIVGSINLDTIIDIERFPTSGETVTTSNPATGYTVAGGKGANQAVACSKLTTGTGRKPAQFVGNFGCDSHSPLLEEVLRAHGVDVSGSGHSLDMPSGQGLVFLKTDGTISSVVVGGSNAVWPPLTLGQNEHSLDGLAARIKGASCVLLQREIPEHINEFVASIALEAGIPVYQDMGGEDRPISDSLLRKLTYVCPNLSELKRLCGLADLDASDDAAVVAAARSLQARGARNVLVTLGDKGSILVRERCGQGHGDVLRAECCAIPGGVAVDETGCGDCFRAAFAVAEAEGKPLPECLAWAAAAGACAVARKGAVPAVPTRVECDAASAAGLRLRGGSAAPSPGDCPWDFASRLNSMKDRPELWDGPSGVEVIGGVERIEGDGIGTRAPLCLGSRVLLWPLSLHTAS
jgi:ribokinase